MHRTVNASQPSLPWADHPLRLKSSICKLRKFFAIKTGVGAASSPTNQSPEHSSPKPNSTHHCYLPVAIPSARLCSPDDAESSAYSDAILSPGRRHPRTLSHSVSTPTMYTFYPPPSESSTRGPSPVNGVIDSRPVMFEMEDKMGPISVVVPKTDQKRWWKWRTRNNSEDAVPPASSLSNHCISPASNLKRSHSVLAASSLRWDETFQPTPPLSTIFPSYPTENLQLSPITSNASDASDDLQYREKPSHQQSRRQSINKLSRTLGVFPNDFSTGTRADKGKSPYNAGSVGKSFAPTRDATEEIPRSRKMNLSLTTKLNMLPSFRRPSSRPPSRAQITPTQSRSRISLSTLNTDDVHRFGLGDDLSDNWGEIRDDSRASIYSSSYSPISPITFKAPTPVAVVPSKRLWALNSSPDNVKPDEVTPASPLLTGPLNHSRSLPLVPPRISRVAQLAGAHSADAPRPHTSDGAETPVPAEANRTESPMEEVAKARSFVADHPEYANEYVDWTGQWNQDDMQHVIKMLRTLK